MIYNTNPTLITSKKLEIQKEEKTEKIQQKTDAHNDTEIEETNQVDIRSPRKTTEIEKKPRPSIEIEETNRVDIRSPRKISQIGKSPRPSIEENLTSPRKSIEQDTVLVYDNKRTFSTLPLKKEVDLSDDEEDQFVDQSNIKFTLDDVDEDEETTINRANLLKDIENERMERMKEYEQFRNDLSTGKLVTNIMKSLNRDDGSLTVSQRIAVKSVDEFRNCFEKFRSSELLDDILSYWKKLLVQADIKEGDDIYSKLKTKSSNIPSFWVKQMYTTFDKKMIHPEYKVPKTDKTIVIVGAGPAGLCSAIECRMLGANVYLLEKRNFITRNNILHLWPFTVDYLKKLSAKTFYSKFAAGSIDHIGTKQMQRLLLKICLLLGVKVFFGTELVSKKLQDDGNGYRITLETQPPVEIPPFHMLIGADGEKSSVSKEFDFGRKEFSGSLSLGITFNFVNHGTKDEVGLREFGISKQFRQKYFSGLVDKYAIDLENLVYYRGETHYFVMAAKKDSLIKRKVFIEELSDISELISPKNINMENLISYVRDVGTYVGIPQSCELEKTHCSDYDVAVFDFSKRTMAEEAVKVLFPRNSEGQVGHCAQFVALVGDSLLQPFWPLGTGCNRALLSALDSTWMLRQICLMDPEKDPEALDTIIKNRTDAFYKMKNCLSGSVSQPYSKCSLDPKSRYGVGNVFIGVQ